LNYRLLDGDTNETLDADHPSLNYSVQMVFTRPDGSQEQYSYTNDGNFFGIYTAQPGYYSYRVTVTGDITAEIRNGFYVIQQEPPLNNCSLHAWVSDTIGGEMPESYSADCMHYLNYELTDDQTGLTVDVEHPSLNYAVSMTVIRPNGDTEYCTYNNDGNYFGIQAGEPGIYTYYVEVTGDIDVAVSGDWYVSPNEPELRSYSLHTWISNEVMGEEAHDLVQGEMYILNYRLTDDDTGMLLDLEHPSLYYRVRMVFDLPDGSKQEVTYDNDSNFFGVRASDPGMYYATAYVTGDVNIQCGCNYYVPPAIPPHNVK